MRMFDDLVVRKGSGTPFDKLEVVDTNKLAQLSKLFGSLPQDYVSFLSSVGFGEIGHAGYMLYNGLLEPDEIYGDVSEQLQGILVFGDDFQDVNTGFRTSSWDVVEIDPTNMQVNAIAPNFSDFIRKRISDLT